MDHIVDGHLLGEDVYVKGNFHMLVLLMKKSSDTCMRGNAGAGIAPHVLIGY